MIGGTNTLLTPVALKWHRNYSHSNQWSESCNCENVTHRYGPVLVCRGHFSSFPFIVMWCEEDRAQFGNMTFVLRKRKAGNEDVDNLLEKRAKCNKKRSVKWRYSWLRDFSVTSKKNSNVLFKMKAFLIFTKVILSALAPTVNASIDFKVPLLTYKAWHCLTPHYIADLLTPSL